MLGRNRDCKGRWTLEAEKHVFSIVWFLNLEHM